LAIFTPFYEIITGIVLGGQVTISKGVDDPETLARYAKGRLREKRPELEEALKGLIGPHQRTILQSQLRMIEFFDEEISRMDKEIAERMLPFEETLERVDGIPAWVGVQLRMFWQRLETM
jgi:hypothetical protein